jgi:ribosomal protein S18 acetylase RimI-like enzyme
MVSFLSNRDFTIRPCRNDECSVVLKLWEDADAVPSKTDTLENLERLVREFSDLFLVAEKEGKIIGTVLGGWDGWRGSIYRLTVLPAYRRHGIGLALVTEAERCLRDKGAQRLSLMVVRQDAPAMSFWKSLEDNGYKHDERIARFAKTL